MARYTASLVVPQPPEEVFAYLADFENVAEWDPGIAEAERLDPGPVGPGTRFRVVSVFLGRRVGLQYAVTKYDPPHRVVLEGRGGSVAAVDTIACEPEAGGTRVTWDARLRLEGAAGWLAPALDPLLGLAFRWIGNDAVRGLREKLGAAG